MLDIAQAITIVDAALSVDRPAASLGRVFDPSQAQLLDALVVRQGAEYNNFGALAGLETEFARFLGEIGNSQDEAKQAAALVARLVKDSLSALHAETAWITIRASKPMARFDIPRWHRDGYYYAPYNDEPRKIVLTLKGAGTRFALLPAAHHAAFDELSRSLPHDDPEREKQMASFVGSAYATQAARHEAYLYITGADHAAIHSEPPIAEDRLFMSIVPGTAAQIEELRISWKQPLTSYGE